MQEISCENCEKKFKDYPSNNRKYCSKACGYKSFQVNHNHSCEWCGVHFTNKIATSKFCGASCAGSHAVTFVKNHRGGSSGDKHWNWKGGGTINTQGYKEIPLGKKNKKMLEHRLVMEKHLMRKLQRNEHVHHINGNKTDNRIENLMVLSPSKHQKLHLQRRHHGTIAFI